VTKHKHHPTLERDLGDPDRHERDQEPDENVVSEIGDEAGVDYAEGEPMRTVDKVTSRDRRRWELDPASSEDYELRSRPRPDDTTD